MGFFEKRREEKKARRQDGRQTAVVSEYFRLIDGYVPVFTSNTGGVYEMTLTQSAIHTFANNCSKLNPVITGSGNEYLSWILKSQPNPIMTSQQFLYRIATILDTEHNVFILPVYEDTSRTQIMGLYPIRPSSTEIVTHSGELFYKFSFKNGSITVIEYDRVGHLKDRYYRDEFFGEGAKALAPTLDLMHAQNEGIINGIKSSAMIRFLVKLNQALKDTDITAEQKRFRENNLDISNDSGALFYDKKYEDIKPVESKPWMIDPKQSEAIRQNVFDYFGTSEKILQNNYSEAEWDAYYEGKIEPFAIQLSQVITNMLFSRRAQGFGNSVLYEANRLQFLTTESKVNLITSMFDRGLIGAVTARQILNMPENEEEMFIRGEYINVKNVSNPFNGGYDAREDTALNGSQVASMVEIVEATAKGLIPPESGIAMLKTAYSIDEKTAEEIMGGAGVSWNVAPEGEEKDAGKNTKSGIQIDASNDGTPDKQSVEQ